MVFQPAVRKREAHWIFASAMVVAWICRRRVGVMSPQAGWMQSRSSRLMAGAKAPRYSMWRGGFREGGGRRWMLKVTVHDSRAHGLTGSRFAQNARLLCVAWSRVELG